MRAFGRIADGTIGLSCLLRNTCCWVIFAWIVNNRLPFVLMVVFLLFVAYVAYIF